MKPTAVGVHSSNAQVKVGVGGAKKPLTAVLAAALQKLSMRERTMLVGLLVVVLIAIALFGLYIPTQDNIAALEEQEVALQTEYANYQQQIALTTRYSESFEASKAQYNAYQKFFYPFMDPEEVDELITGILKDYKLEPSALTMSALSEEPLAFYSAAPLVPNAVPAPQKRSDEQAGAGGADSNTAAPNAADGGSGGSTSSAAGSGAGIDISTADKDTTVYVYTIDVQADGTNAALLKFLDKSKTKYGFEVTSWSFNNRGITNASKTGGASGSSTSVQLQIKLYVFLGGPIN